MFLPVFSMALFIARRRDGRTLLFDNAIWSKRSARMGRERERGSNGNPGADVEIVSIVTPPPSLVVPLEHSEKTCAQLHAQTSPLYPSAGLCGKPPFCFNICCSNQFEPSCSSCVVIRYTVAQPLKAACLPVACLPACLPACLAGVNMHISKYLMAAGNGLRLYIPLQTDT